MSKYTEWPKGNTQLFFETFRGVTEDRDFMFETADKAFSLTMEPLGDLFLNNARANEMDEDDIVPVMLSADIIRKTMMTLIEVGVETMILKLEANELEIDGADATDRELYPVQLAAIRNIADRFLKITIPELTVMVGQAHVEAVKRGIEQQDADAFAEEATAELAKLFEQQGVVTDES